MDDKYQALLNLCSYTMEETKESIVVPKLFQNNEDDLSQDCKELIHTLPIEEPWITSPLYQYQGFWHFKKSLQGVLSFQKHFEANDSDIFLVTTPKSGTTWLKALTFALVNRKRYPPPAIDNEFGFPAVTGNHPLLISNPHDLVPFLEIGLYTEKDVLPDLNSLASPRIFSTHLAYVSLSKNVLKCKMVYLCRDPKDTFISLWNFANKLRLAYIGSTLPLEEGFDKFCRGVSQFGPYWDHVLGFWKESLERPQNVMFLRYEEMKMKPAFYLKELAEFLGCPFSKEEESAGVVDDILYLCSFEKLSNLEVNKTGKFSSGMKNEFFFRRGQVGDYKNFLTDEMIERLNTITEEKLGKHGLSF